MRVNLSQGNSPKMKTNGEILFKGRAVSRGVGIGSVLCLYGQKRQFYKIRIKRDKVESEIKRFLDSVRLAKYQLKKISGSKDDSIGENQISIFETHLLFLEDKSLLTKIEKTIQEEKVNAEWAVQNIVDSYVLRYKLLSDQHLREKYIDLEDIGERLLTALGGGQKSVVEFSENTIIVAKELNPSTLIELSLNKPKAIVTENGGWTSHTFILTRELNLPAVTGLKGFLRRVKTGEQVIVDGFNGEVTLKPNDETTQRFKVSESEFQKTLNEKIEFSDESPRTLDGIEIHIRANLDLTRGYEQAKVYGARGIGLYRSEFLFNQNKGFPTEEEQFESYKKVADFVGDDGIKIRTFDLGVEQLADRSVEQEKNPALGLRGIRLGLADEFEFRRQLRALLRASYKSHIDIILPMISDVLEVLQSKRILEQEKERLLEDGFKVGNPKLGAMIEVPSAVMTVDKIIQEVDFVNVGTNDLVQYLLAVDRDNEAVADWFRTLHPSVLRSIKMVLEASEKFEKPAIICGEMAGSPLYAAILIGLGAKELSMNLNSILRVRKIISGIAFEEARVIVKELEECRTSSEVEEKVREGFTKKWSHLFDEYSLLPQINWKN